MLESDLEEQLRNKGQQTCTTSLRNIGPCRKVTARRAERRNLVFWRLPQIAALVVPDHLPASSIVPSRPACSGFQTRIIRRSVELKLIRISVLAARNARAKAQMALSSTAAPGTRLKWCRPTIGKGCMGSHFLMRRPQRRPKKLFILCKAAPDGLSCQGRLIFYSIRTNRAGRLTAFVLL